MRYTKLVEDCFFHPQHVGELNTQAPNSVHKRLQIKGQTTCIDLFLQCDEVATITQARFKAVGNPYTIAALEWICRQVEGSELTNLPQIDYQVLIQELGVPTLQYPYVVQVANLYQEVVNILKTQLTR